jgi:hypothetical protein
MTIVIGSVPTSYIGVILCFQSGSDFYHGPFGSACFCDPRREEANENICGLSAGCFCCVPGTARVLKGASSVSYLPYVVQVPNPAR